MNFIDTVNMLLEKMSTNNSPLNIPISKFDGTRKFWVTPSGELLHVERVHSGAITSSVVAEFGLTFPDNLQEMEPAQKDTAIRWAALKQGFIRGVIRRDGALTLEAGRIDSRTVAGLKSILMYEEEVYSTAMKATRLNHFVSQINYVGLTLLKEDEEGNLMQTKKFGVNVPSFKGEDKNLIELEGFISDVKSGITTNSAFDAPDVNSDAITKELDKGGIRQYYKDREGKGTALYGDSVNPEV